jgi:hypothetical protein
MSRRLRTAAVAGLLTLGVVGGGAAVAATTGPAIHTFTPKSEQQITNIDVLRQQIRNYYGDPLGSGVSSPDSSYAREAEGVARAGRRWLRARTPDAHHHARHDSGTPAIVLDVDDTTLLTWNYEIASNWAYNPVTNGEYVTGRPSPQEAATLGNLTSDGIGVDARYPAPTTLPDGEDGLFTKPAVNEYPQYLRDACAGDLPDLAPGVVGRPEPARRPDGGGSRAVGPPPPGAAGGRRRRPGRREGADARLGRRGLAPRARGRRLHRAGPAHGTHRRPA